MYELPPKCVTNAKVIDHCSYYKANICRFLWPPTCRSTDLHSAQIPNFFLYERPPKCVANANVIGHCSYYKANICVGFCGLLLAV